MAGPEPLTVEELTALVARVNETEKSVWLTYVYHYDRGPIQKYELRPGTYIRPNKAHKGNPLTMYHKDTSREDAVYAFAIGDEQKYGVLFDNYWFALAYHRMGRAKNGR